MQIEGSHKGILSVWSKTALKDGTEAPSKAVVTVRMDKEELGKAVGAEFAKSVFSFLVEDEDQGEIWTHGTFKPRGNYPTHTVKIGGGKGLAIDPRVTDVIPVDGEAKVDMKIELPFICKDIGLAGKLHAKVGNQVTVDLAVREPEMDMPGGTKVTSGKFGNPKHVVVND